MKNLLAAAVVVASGATAAVSQPTGGASLNMPCGEGQYFYNIIANKGLKLLMSGDSHVEMSDKRMHTGAAQVFLNPESGDFTFLLTFQTKNPDEPMTCLITYGEDFEPYTGPQPGDK